MSDFDRGMTRTGPVAAPDMAIDAGLRSFMLGVYNKVALGLVLSAVLAYITGTVPAVQHLLFRTGEFGRIQYTDPRHGRCVRTAWHPAVSGLCTASIPAERELHLLGRGIPHRGLARHDFH